ncbi:MAG: Gfo/Idh/MocA family oxidoreductase [Opitutales bacterium]|nr:Gfo/Idh/MocA family oxidoreductase [Opitutales bacterium]
MKRRTFIKNTAGMLAVVGFPTIIPASALGKGGKVAPSERVCVGAIGLGTQGTYNTKMLASDPRVQIVALCDVNNTEGTQYYGYDNKRTFGLRNARKIFGMDVPCYNDYRELLARKDVDAVMAALPDHWHAIVAIDAIRAGKDIYGEKPITRTIEEGKLLRDAVLSSGCVWQTGSVRRTQPYIIRLADMIASGALGKIKRIQIGLPANFTAETLPAVEVPKGLDWDMWQGPAPLSTYYHPNKTFTRWRGIQNYCAGKIADWGAHFLDFAHLAIGCDKSGPLEIVPNQVEWAKDGFSDQPMKYKVSFYYKNGVEIEMSDENIRGVEFFGEKGSVLFIDGTLSASHAKYVDIEVFQKLRKAYPHRGDTHHFSAFIDSVIDRRKTASDIEIPHRTNTACLLGEIAYKVNRPIRWDPDKEVIIGDAQASRYCSRAYRAPWTLQA